MSDDLREFLAVLNRPWRVESVVELEGSMGRFYRVVLRTMVPLKQWSFSFEIDAGRVKVPKVGSTGRYGLILDKVNGQPNLLVERGNNA